MYMKKKIVIFSIIVVSILLILPKLQAKAATLTTGSVSMADSRISTSTTYTITFSNITTSAIKCINVAFKDAATAGNKPTGMTVTSAALSGTSTYIPTPASWTTTPNNTTGVVAITYATGETPASSGPRTVVLNTITNGSTAGTAYFVQFSTFNNTDCSTSPVDSAVIAYIHTNGQTVTATVDPTLTFTIAAVTSGGTVNGATTNITTTSTTVPFGTLSTSTNRIGAHDLTIGTNAAGGYTVTAMYTGNFTKGAGVNIANHSGTNASPTSFSAAGTEAFGYTTNDTTLGTGTAGRFTSNTWAAFTTSPVEVAYNGSPVSQTIRTGYQVGIAATTPAGSYTTTVVYTATPVY